jgi:hypothetical protein
MKGTERDWLLDVAGELSKMMAGVNMVHVQYRGDAGGKANEPFAMRHLTVPNSRCGSNPEILNMSIIGPQCLEQRTCRAASRSHTLETHIYRLRQKVENDAGSPSVLITESGGYKLVP